MPFDNSIQAPGSFSTYNTYIQRSHDRTILHIHYTRRRLSRFPQSLFPNSTSTNSNIRIMYVYYIIYDPLIFTETRYFFPDDLKCRYWTMMSEDNLNRITHTFLAIKCKGLFVFQNSILFKFLERGNMLNK